VGVVAYPNPSSKTMTVDLASFEGESAVVMLVDYFERTVFEQSDVRENLILDVSRFAAGSYLLLVRSASKQAATAVIVK
jgi:protein involved in sex pheromone biosynthesis